jgi:hypothetical protein
VGQRFLMLLGLAVLCAGCGHPDEVTRRRQQWAAERAALAGQLDDLGARLLETQARVHFWKEMRGRHEHVSAVACTNLAQHAAGMAAFYEKVERRVADQRKARTAMGSRRHAKVVEAAATTGGDE